MSSDPIRESAVRPYGRRADAERNREAILDHAARLLVEDPSIGMGEIAADSGIGRATVYRHFATREELIEAIADRAIDETEHAIVASSLDEGTATGALRRLIAALLDIGDRYRFLLAQNATQADAEKKSKELEERITARLVGLFERGQESGEFSPSMPSLLMAGVLGLTVVAATHKDLGGSLPQDRAVDVVTEFLLYGLAGAAGS
jgi:AcrR family transcriptional regulator